MGTFYTECLVQNHVDRSRKTLIPKLLVDTGSEYTWIRKEILDQVGVLPEEKEFSFVMANGELIKRRVGFAILRIGEYFTIDEVVFAQPTDLLLLGARTMEGMNVRVEPTHKKLVAAGPLPVAGVKKANNLNCSIESDGKFFIAHCLDLSVTTQGKTKSEAENNLKEALELYQESWSKSI